MSIVFDSGTIISLSEKCFSKVLEEMSKKARLCIPPSVEREIVKTPLEIERFELNAIRIERAIKRGWISTMELDQAHVEYSRKIMRCANSLFWAKSRPLLLLQEAETQAIGLAKQLGAKTLAVDERNTRLLIEDIDALKGFLERKYGNIETDNAKAEELAGLVGGISVVRSAELFAFAFTKGLLASELEQEKRGLEAGLLALKFSGCSISRKEIMEYLSGV